MCLRRTANVAVLVMATLFLLPGVASADDFSPYVGDDGSITLPENFRTEWAFLGTWAVAADEGGAEAFHNVFTQPGTIGAFRATGEFPDGAVLVKELLEAKTDGMTTGEVSYATEVTGWFVMIKDQEGRYADNPLWGDGWGWALFYADDPGATVTEDYKSECIPCHIPAKKDDWVYIRGYPVLHE